MLIRLFVILLLLLWLPCAWSQVRLDIVVKPANKAIKENIQAYIGSLEDYDEEALQRYRSTALSMARQASEALGYYQNSYQVTTVSGNKPKLRIEVALAEPVRLRKVDIQVLGQANQLPVFTELADERLLPGAILHHGAYEDLKSKLQQYALRYGFFMAKFTQQRLDIEPEMGAADISLHFDSGPRYYLGAVEFSEQSWIEPQLLNRLVPFKEGDAYNSAVLARLSQNLQATGYFEQIRVDAVGEPDGPLLVPVRVSLQRVKPRTFGVGAGFSTDIGPRARFNWEQHRINRHGHKLGFETEWSKPQQSVTGWYAIPLEAPLTDQLRFVSGYQREEYVDAQSRRYTYGAQWHKHVGHDWQRVVGLRWDEERYDYGRAQPEKRSQFLLPSLGFSKLKSDSAIDPSVGYRLQADISGAKQDFFADADVLHVSALVRGLITLADKHRFLGRTQVGAIATNNYARIPPSLRFFAGGDQSVRGYDYQSLSPRDEYRNRIGGRYLFAQSVEYQYSLTDTWRIASFVDRGNAVENWTDAMKTGVGVGVRWVSPIGPLRLDWAHALNDDRGWRIHFSMGPEL
ncbi:autotransporter assembly complex protein TamA [Thiopseudomonas acetoxidans]|uniref:Translocation and assembly module subunit TamA n=1 Tax=Thiopseudomonas acetoxidans TaxID=3041622 RepID=A0ABT7SQ75_9GAMM|nr:autotransporter assembly complex family protein [Thiopseudomonas sp. CY1220]MDM7858342.1 autotransporter assembly complex family protein [Thiopseudomonas sp. CY1220]